MSSVSLGSGVVTLGTLIAGEDQAKDLIKVEQRYLFLNVASATTTTIENAIFLHAIVINTTAAGGITIYDNTEASGTKVGTLKASVVEGTYTYNCLLGTGLTIVTAAASDITIIYRT
jgi:hypothetical protein